jgi:hypothetical protein
MTERLRVIVGTKSRFRGLPLKHEADSELAAPASNFGVSLPLCYLRRSSNKHAGFVRRARATALGQRVTSNLDERMSSRWRFDCADRSNDDEQLLLVSRDLRPQRAARSARPIGAPFGETFGACLAIGHNFAARWRIHVPSRGDEDQWLELRGSASIYAPSF